tara:strand:+ start:8707 stop:10287 length:1581 start_codon:yes stop_codon:yes gene_type:complete
MVKSYSQGKDLREKILRGASVLADNVASTLGPKGRNVILHKEGASPMITKDGVTVAKFVKLEDPFENLGAQIIKQAASNTNSTAGDGTTTSTVLAREMLSKAQKYIAAGASPIDIKRGMDKATEAITTKLENLARPIKSEEDIRHIATISANGDTSIGEMIAMAVDKIGKDGAISIEEGRSMKTSLDIVEGFRFDAGYCAQAFVTNKRKQSINYDDVLLLVTNYKIEMLEEILPILEVVAREGRPFMIVSEELEGQALAALIMNTVRGTMKVAAIKAPRYGQERRSILEDLCISTGATFVSRDSGLKLADVKLKHLGSAKKIEVLKNQTTIVDGKADWSKVDERIESLKSEIKQTDGIAECEKLQERITRLSSGVAVIRVGAPTEIEMVEKKHRIEDALEAVRSAQLEGTLPGGGTSLIRAVQDLEVETDNDDQRLGVEVIRQSAYGPLKQMSKNAGESYDLILNRLLDSPETHGWNFATNEVVDMYENGIIDPAKVTRTALQNATSVSSTLITTNHAIVETSNEG